jgi:hypothetical protein
MAGYLTDFPWSAALLTVLGFTSLFLVFWSIGCPLRVLKSPLVFEMLGSIACRVFAFRVGDVRITWSFRSWKGSLASV